MFSYDLLDRVVGYTDPSPDVAKGLTRWGRVTGDILAGGHRFLSIALLHGSSDNLDITMGERVHTVMPKAY